jgi:AcrR family transcriptional regulator
MQVMSSSSRAGEAASDDDTTRVRILEAALRLLTDEGHVALTVRRVAAEAGCSTIGVYTWFGGKDGLVDALWTEGFASFDAALRRARPADGPLGRLQGLARAYRRWALRHPRHYRVMFLNAVVGHTPGPDAVAVSLSAFVALQDAVTEAANRHELVTDDLDAVALTMWGAVHGLVALELAGAAPPSAASRALANRSYALAVATLVRGFAREGRS